MDVEVLGTAFNINAYPGEDAARTTLAEGVVKVSANGTGRIIRPGQQTAERFGGPGIDLDPKADVAGALAWKNGRFAFHDADVPAVMRQLARWYDVEVSYEGTIPRRAFNGKIDRNLTLDQVIRILTKTRVHYTIGPGCHLIIRP
jgi:transmembrane sensor